jgi:hypothetical protein
MKALIKYIYSGREEIITSIDDLALLFEVFCLADQVRTLCVHQYSAVELGPVLVFLMNRGRSSASS